LYNFNSLILTTTRLGSKFMNVTNSIVLLRNTYYILCSPNHFLMNFPRCDLFPFGNHKTNHQIYIIILYSSIDSTKPYSITMSLISAHIAICLVATSLGLKLYWLKLTWFHSLWSLRITNMMYSTGIKGCNS
jgi:hypothetical protein